jgi:hypothetical protein
MIANSIVGVEFVKKDTWEVESKIGKNNIGFATNQYGFIYCSLHKAGIVGVIGAKFNFR